MTLEKTVSILGSTGSIGTQSLTVCQKQGYPVYALTAHSNWKLLEQQIRQYRPRYAALTDPQAAKELKDRVQDTGTEVLSGMEGVLQIAADPQQDTVLNAMMGVAGLLPTVTAIEAGNNVALANKETLVAGGKLVMGLAKQKGIRLTPIDSEHSAIFQCLQGNEAKSVKRLIITGLRRAVLRQNPRGTARHQKGAGAQTPELEHGRQDHHRFLHPDEQGAGIYRSDVAVLDAAGKDRHRGAPAEHHPLDGGVCGRLGDGPDGRAGHDDSDPVRADLAAPACTDCP